MYNTPFVPTLLKRALNHMQTKRMLFNSQQNGLKMEKENIRKNKLKMTFKKNTENKKNAEDLFIEFLNNHKNIRDFEVKKGLNYSKEMIIEKKTDMNFVFYKLFTLMDQIYVWNNFELPIITFKLLYQKSKKIKKDIINFILPRNLLYEDIVKAYSVEYTKHLKKPNYSLSPSIVYMNFYKLCIEPEIVQKKRENHMQNNISSCLLEGTDFVYKIGKYNRKYRKINDDRYNDNCNPKYNDNRKEKINLKLNPNSNIIHITKYRLKSKEKYKNNYKLNFHKSDVTLGKTLIFSGKIYDLYIDDGERENDARNGVSMDIQEEGKRNKRREVIWDPDNEKAYSNFVIEEYRKNNRKKLINPIKINQKYKIISKPNIHLDFNIKNNNDIPTNYNTQYNNTETNDTKYIKTENSIYNKKNIRPIKTSKKPHSIKKKNNSLNYNNNIADILIYNKVNDISEDNSKEKIKRGKSNDMSNYFFNNTDFYYSHN